MYQQQQPPPAPPMHRTQQSRTEILQSMRKHRSLDNAQFLQQMASMGASTSTPYNIPSNSYATTSAYSTSYGNTASYGYPTTSTSQTYMNPYLTNPPPPQGTTSTGMDSLGLDMPLAYGYGAYPGQYASSKLNDYQTHDYSATNNYSTTNTSAAVGSYPGIGTRTPHYAMASSSFGQMKGNASLDSETEMLKREVAEMTEKLNYVMNSIRNFWSPELKKERQQRRDESMRMASLQDKISQQSAEIQVIRNELEKREKDIGHLLSESDLGEMEEELRRLRKQLTEPPTRDYTNKALSIHEMQTLKMKMERSELALAEKTQALQSCEIRLKCAEEQNAEFQKRLDFLSRSNVVNENQVKMVNEDVNVLRGKLETKNQLIESKDRSTRKLEGEMETLRVQLQEASHKLQESEHKVAQLNHRLDQMESLRRDRDGEVERLKRRLMQQPGTRVETELQQRIENVEADKRKLQETIDSLVKNAELDKHQQLKTFEEENRHLRATIESLQKELSDRQILLASQNEKISQLDLQTKQALRENGHDRRTDDQMENVRKEMEESQKTVDRLLRIVHDLEKDKNALRARIGDSGPERPSSALQFEYKDAERSLDRKSESVSLKMRIQQLEEALRESVGITSERDKQIVEQKQLLQQLNNQVAELYKDVPGRADQRVMQEAAKAEGLHRQLTEAREQFQRQMLNLRKEAVMAVVREKEACILLLKGPPDTINEKVEILARQKEQLKHRLLSQDDGMFSTGEGGPYLANTWLHTEVAQPLDLSTSLFQQRYGVVSASAPPSFTHGIRDDTTPDDDGIWT